MLIVEGRGERAQQGPVQLRCFPVDKVIQESRMMHTQLPDVNGASKTNDGTQ